MRNGILSHWLFNLQEKLCLWPRIINLSLASTGILLVVRKMVTPIGWPLMALQLWRSLAAICRRGIICSGLKKKHNLSWEPCIKKNKYHHQWMKPWLIEWKGSWCDEGKSRDRLKSRILGSASSSENETGRLRLRTRRGQEEGRLRMWAWNQKEDKRKKEIK